MRHFDLCVIGTGSGNSIVDERFADWDVAMLDDGVHFGGTCLNVGCIPTKMFVIPADYARAPEEAAPLGVHLGSPRADWPAIRDRIFGRIDAISSGGESYRQFADNVTLYRATGRFVGERTLEVAGEQITADRVVVAAGSRATMPSIPGLADAVAAGRAHTSDTVMRLDRLPASLAIIGSGFIAAEFAHVFAAYGTAVTVLARSGTMLRDLDEDLSRRATRAIEGYTDFRGTFSTQRVELVDGGVRLHGSDDAGRACSVDAEVVLVATGRVPNSDRLDAERGGIAVGPRGFIEVDAHQRTTAENVWALGDVSSPWLLKHVANHEARVVQHNLLHPDDPVESNHHAVPHAVFGHPQIAAVGLTEEQARADGRDITVAVQPYGSVAYGWALEDTDSVCKVIADRQTAEILGAHLIGPQAATLIQPLIQAMATGLDARTMARGQYWIHPALTEVIENALLALDLA
ncbi:mycothione reductase [Propioniciclava soli]|uniref:Mycothione reductase n=1 Tax=Propioniciclava soli TaxID=2775081 RepID=A0ABZ3C994_9ACTN